MNESSVTYFAVEAKRAIDKSPVQYTRNGQRHNTIESARGMVNALRNVIASGQLYDVRILKITTTEEVVSSYGAKDERRE